ncbi:MAG: ATP-binding protein [Syntrophales bacterium]|nr:ATP-binding protein [Syntrophales bacterium]MCK9527163.1 ATP-binding protein [Syntrophales bacterium]MDX9921712.1 ATP-binding protein [Syntrophales bacterium]
MKNSKKAAPAASVRRSWIMLSPWIVIGTVIILVPIVIFMALYSIEKQKDAMTRLLAEKGAALIRSFEAGARAGIPATGGTSSQIQTLLVETAQQPDIVYLLITDLNGSIVAHNNPKEVGRYHGRGLDLREIAATEALYYRTLKDQGQKEIFEVFRYFAPSQAVIPAPLERAIPDDVFRGDPSRHPALMIFIGLDREPVASALKADFRMTATLALILLLIGFTGVISLLVAEGYRQARSSLSRVKVFSDNLVEHMPIGIIATDSTAVITSFNQVAEEVLRIPAADVLGRPVRAVLSPALADVLDRFEETVTFFEEEITCLLPDGRPVPLDVVATTLMDEKSFMGHAILIRDLTEVKRLRKEVERSRHLASLGRMAAGVAHEIRNPLSSIKGFATYFRDRYPDVPEDQKTADIMISEVERLNRAIGQLLELSRPLRVRRSPVSPAFLVKTSLETISSRAGEQNVEIDRDLPEVDYTLEADADGLNQVLLNLYLNALDSMPSGGRLLVRLVRDGNFRTTLSVTDTGGGIEDADLPKIFDPYYTTKSTGTGLGLAIVHKIIEAHGGDIHVESTPGQGTTVSVTIPAKPPPTGTNRGDEP